MKENSLVHESWRNKQNADVKRLAKMRATLREFAGHVRTTWHEPDEQGLTAAVRGERFDNADPVFGEFAQHWSRIRYDDELHVFLRKGTRSMLVINLADLFAMATFPWEAVESEDKS